MGGIESWFLAPNEARFDDAEFWIVAKNLRSPSRIRKSAVN